MAPTPMKGGIHVNSHQFSTCPRGPQGKICWRLQTKKNRPVDDPFEFIAFCSRYYQPMVNWWFGILVVNWWFGILVVWDSKWIPLRIPIPLMRGSQESKPPLADISDIDNTRIFSFNVHGRTVPKLRWLYSYFLTQSCDRSPAWDLNLVYISFLKYLT